MTRKLAKEISLALEQAGARGAAAHGGKASRGRAFEALLRALTLCLTKSTRHNPR